MGFSNEPNKRAGTSELAEVTVRGVFSPEQQIFEGGCSQAGHKPPEEVCATVATVIRL
jgi:hypothetical protein